MFLSALLTYVINIICRTIKVKYLSSNTNKQFGRNDIKIPLFKLKNNVVTSLLIYLIIVIVSKIRLKQQQKKSKVCIIIRM